MQLAAIPFFRLGVLYRLPGVGVEIQWFGLIVAIGVLVGTALLRRYAIRYAVTDRDIRHLTGWVIVCGFAGAHLFDVLGYQWSEIASDPLVVIKLWAGISSYGGFIGGAAGFVAYVWRRHLPAGLMADVTIVGLLPAFSIGRIGCSVVSDHIGAAVDPRAWYAALAEAYPRTLDLAHLADRYPGTSDVIAAWNLGLVELLVLIPINALILWLAFRATRWRAAGSLAVITALLYTPVRFGLDFLRPEETDPRLVGLTFAQWASIAVFAVAIYAGRRISTKSAAQA